MSTRSFDLRTRPWIPVRDRSGADREVSLSEVYRLATELTGLGGELPTTSAALLRLLVAVLHASLDVPQRPGEAWRGLWRAAALPCDDIDGYLAEHADRFDLWHPRTPFLQVADLTTATGTGSSLLPLIADVPNNDQFFTTWAGGGTASIDEAEAARWLVHCQAFDPSGIKSGAVGDARVKGGKGYPIGTGWAGQLGLVLLEGATLKDTLLLNLSLATRTGEPWPADDLPIWERDPLTAGLAPQANAYPQVLELLTWSSRRLRLIAEGSLVTGALICNGDRIAPQNQLAEPMTAWRRSPAQEKKLGRDLIYMPLTHSPERALWRGLSALLPQVPATVRDGAERLEPLTLRWLRRLKHDDETTLPDGMPLRTRAVGVVYGSNNSIIEEIIDDGLLIHAVLLGRHGEQLRRAAVDAVADADSVAGAVGRLAGNLVTAAGGDQAPARDQAREGFYVTVDLAFRRWLSGLGPGTDAGEARRGWQHAVDHHARAAERELVTAAGPAAWVGRSVQQGGRTQWFDTGLASRRFQASLREALLMVYSAPSDDPTPAPDLQEAT